MAVKKFKVGIIGTGSIGSCHASSYVELAKEGKCELIACCDLDRKKALAFAEKYGIPKENVYTKFEKMIEEVKLDCVSVTTWNRSHMAPTVYALDHGINVLCEKPTAMNTSQALKMKEAADRSGKILQIGFVRRFGDDAALAKKLIDAGEIGELYYAKAFYMRQRGCPGGWFADKSYSGGGPLIDLGVHVIDLIRYLTGGPKAVEVFGTTNRGLMSEGMDVGAWNPSESNGRVFKKDVEDITTAMIRFDNGMVLNFEATFNLNMPEEGRNGVEIFGKKNGVVVTDRTRIARPLPEKSKVKIPEEPQQFGFTKGLKDEADEFLRTCRTGKQTITTPEDGVEVMRIIDAIYKSAKLGHSVTIKR